MLLVVEVAVVVLSLAVLSPALLPLVTLARSLISVGRRPVVTRFASWSLRHSTSVRSEAGSS